MVSVTVCYLFYRPMDEMSKRGLFLFAAKENPNMEKTLFDWPIVLQCDVKAKYRLISRTFSGMKFFHPTVRLTNQKPRAFNLCPFDKPITSISVRLLFLFGSRVFISRSYENRSMGRYRGVVCGGYYTMARRCEFYFRVAKQYFTNERCEWVKYCFCHSKIKFISSSRRAMFFLLYRQKINN